MAIHWVDMAIIVAYLCGITGLGLWFSRHQRDSSAGYFLAGRSLGWATVGLALFATNISTVHLTGLAGAGFSTGMVFGNFEWMAPFLLILLGLVFAPFYFRTRIATLPEYLEGRYGPASRTVLAFMAVVGALFIHIGVTLYAGAEVMKSLIDIDTPRWWTPLAPHLDFNIAVSIGLVSLLTILYTALGGLKAVVVTESVQTVLLLLGAAAITAFGLVELSHRGATSLEDLHRMALEQEARDAVAEVRADAPEAVAGARDDGMLRGGEIDSAPPRSPRLSMIHSTGDYTWWIMLLGYPILGIWYWCADQTIVQRVLGARSEWDAQVGPIFAGFIKVLPVFLMVFPGVIAYLLFRDVVGDDADATLSVLILELLPRGMQGLVLAGVLAAMMSTVAGALNSTATLVSIDIVKRLRPGTADRTLVRVGQATAVVVMIAAVAWSTQGERFGGIFAGINQMISVLAPPISTVFVWGVFWRRGTSTAALTTLLGGFALGAVVFVADFPAFGFRIVTEGWGIPFLLQAWILFVICSAVYVAVSLLTPPPAPSRVDRYCWSNPLAVVTESRISGPTDPRVLALLLVLVMVACYSAFA
jgi:SSS family solute:Na+ symporter